MSSPYVGEIRMFGGSFAPAGWEMCAGQLLPISEYETLFNLIGTTYGGDGQETFGLPNLSGRIPLHMGQGPGLSQNYQIGEAAGVESVTLNLQQIPIHNHAALASKAGASQKSLAGGIWTGSSVNAYSAPLPATAMHASIVGFDGGSQPHENMMPYLCVTFIISMFGIFPSQT